MNYLLNAGRIFFGISIIGIGILHFIFPGVRPIIIPNLTQIPSAFNWMVYFIALLLIVSGGVISIGKKFNAISFGMGIIFLLLLFFGHLPAFISGGADKFKYWINMFKVLALSGGFLLVSEINVSKIKDPKFVSVIRKVAPWGKYLFAVMLFIFGLGHLFNAEAVSTLVPEYIPLKVFWTFVGGIGLVGSAVSFFIGFKIRMIALLLAAMLFIWLITLHLYYAVRFPNWQEGENFIGVFTCLAFCGTALTISQLQRKKANVRVKNQ